MSIAKIINLNLYDQSGTRCFIGERELPVFSANFHMNADEIPIFEFKIMLAPSIPFQCLEQDSVASQLITDAISVLRHELLQHGEIYRGFKASLKSALEHYNYCGLPFESDEEKAEKILDFLIGDEKE